MSSIGCASCTRRPSCASPTAQVGSQAWTLPGLPEGPGPGPHSTRALGLELHLSKGLWPDPHKNARPGHPPPGSPGLDPRPTVPGPPPCLRVLGPSHCPGVSGPSPLSRVLKLPCPALKPKSVPQPRSPTGIRQAFQEKKVASLIGVEGGHSIDSSLGVLRTLYHLGMRYLTLTHNCNTPWADNWLVDTGTDDAQSQGLSPFGKVVLKEMNRLGIMVDLAHVSVATMWAVLNHSSAPVIFSHSSSYTICQHRRNVPDDVLQRVKQTGSLVMVNFYNDYVSCKDKANLSQVADHLDHIKKVAGAEAVGFGGDFDGVTRLPTGLEDVSKYPDLVAELLRRNWTETEVRGALANNLLRVFEAVEQVSHHTQKPEEEPIELDELEGSCRTQYGYSAAPGVHQKWGILLAALAPFLLSWCQ
nr:dipeptidase 1 isoform X1 [Loxodonta africana]